MPTSSHGPQLRLMAGCPQPRRYCARLSKKALAAAYVPCPSGAKTAAAEEKSTKKSSSPVNSCRCQAPAALPASTRSSRVTS